MKTTEEYIAHRRPADDYADFLDELQYFSNIANKADNIGTEEIAGILHWLFYRVICPANPQH